LDIHLDQDDVADAGELIVSAHYRKFDSRGVILFIASPLTNEPVPRLVSGGEKNSRDSRLIADRRRVNDHVFDAIGLDMPPEPTKDWRVGLEGMNFSHVAGHEQRVLANVGPEIQKDARPPPVAAIRSRKK
jgi:hypothetical protein